ncbi:IPT/TIG domain-containing protein [Pseudoscourfieldia marina]
MSYNSLQSTAVASPVLYFKYASPTIASATSIATAGGRTTITGTNFGPDTANLQLVEIRNTTTGVYHTGTNCAITSHTTIECDVACADCGRVGDIRHRIQLHRDLGRTGRTRATMARRMRGLPSRARISGPRVTLPAL